MMLSTIRNILKSMIGPSIMPSFIEIQIATILDSVTPVCKRALSNFEKHFFISASFLPLQRLLCAGTKRVICR